MFTFEPLLTNEILCGYLRDDEFDFDLEDIMVMEAIWLSIQVSPLFPMSRMQPL
jgi:hypothetical protein